MTYYERLLEQAEDIWANHMLQGDRDALVDHETWDEYLANWSDGTNETLVSLRFRESWLAAEAQAKQAWIEEFCNEGMEEGPDRPDRLDG